MESVGRASPPTHKTLRVAIGDTSQVGEARRAAVSLAIAAGLDEAERGRLALIISEAAMNVARHGGGGEILLRALSDERAGVEMIAVDKGSGISDLDAAMRDGYSTRGTAGGGLGAMARQASVFDIVSAPGAGTIVLAQVWHGNPARPKVEIGAICLALAGEDACGDDWTAEPLRGGVRLLVADGLGHGAAAEVASADATRVFRGAVNDSAPQAIERVHLALRGGRGAAVAAAFLDAAQGAIEFAGVGNIAGVVRGGDGATSRSMVSQNGTAGHAVRRLGSFMYEWPANAVVILHSDGITTHWSLDRFPGLTRRHPGVIAAAIYRDHARGRDDTTVVVCRRAAELAS